jgi:hypothetical protein
MYGISSLWLSKRIPSNPHPVRRIFVFISPS